MKLIRVVVLFSCVLLHGTSAYAQVPKREGQYTLLDRRGFQTVGQKVRNTHWQRCPSRAENVLDKFRGELAVDVDQRKFKVNSEQWRLLNNTRLTVAGIMAATKEAPYILSMHIEHERNVVSAVLVYFDVDVDVDEDGVARCATALELKGSFNGRIR